MSNVSDYAKNLADKIVLDSNGTDLKRRIAEAIDAESGVTVESIVGLLNEMFALDPAATRGLVMHRVPCNEALVEHPTVVVSEIPTDTDKVERTVGMVGVLNGIAGFVGKRVECIWDTGEIAGFAVGTMRS
jgi:hypothetical protein